MRILIIGGTKFIGRATALRLHEAGHTVAVFNRGQTPADLPAGITHLAGSLEALPAAGDALRQFAPEVVLHNIVLQERHVRELQAALRGVARRLVMTSSVDVYRQFGRILGTEPGDLIPGESDEDAPLRTVLYPYRRPEMAETERLYHYDKIPAERAALDDPALPGTVVRLPMVIGEQDWQRRLLPFVQPMRDGRPAIVLDETYANWYSTYGYVDNMAHALALAVTDDRAAGHIFNAADTALPILTLAQMVQAAMGWPGELIAAPPAQLPEDLHFGVPQVQDLRVRAERIRQVLAYAPPVDFAEGVQRTVQWELAQPPVQPPNPLVDYSAQDAALRALRGA
ncbi:MAG: NAD-dependent epimerase/dehydratase family protein [Anaerolineae bacterium]|nr:NAD-dependent epimerase/dehydratase family protein [Anaerolineae bacterium]